MLTKEGGFTVLVGFLLHPCVIISPPIMANMLVMQNVQNGIPNHTSLLPFSCCAYCSSCNDFVYRLLTLSFAIYDVSFLL